MCFFLSYVGCQKVNKIGGKSQSELQVPVINAIEIRRLHMIECAQYNITKQKLATYLKQKQPY
jgi:hypothetical protein